MYSPVLSTSYSPLKDFGASRSTIDSSDSPYLTRVKSIGKRLNNVQTTIEVNHAVERTEQLETKIRQIDQKVTNNHTTTEEKINNCTLALNNLDETLAAEIIARELLEDRKLKEMRIVETNIALELKNERQESKEAERRALGQVDQRIHAVRLGFAEEQERIEDFKKEQTQAISDRIADLHHSLKEEQTVREQTQNNLLKKVSNKISQFQETMASERKARNDTEAFLFKKLEDLNAGLQKQVNTEREKRERVESQMLALLEEACGKFEDQVRVLRR